MIYDLIIVIITILFVVIGAFRGAAKTLMNLLCVLVSGVASIFLGKLFASMIYDAMIKNVITDTVSKAVGNAASNAAGSIESAVDALPGFLKSLFGAFGGQLDHSLSVTADTAASVAEQTLRPIILALSAFLLTVVLFILLCFLLKLIAVRPISKLFENYLSGVNRFFGALLGLVEAFLAIMVLAYLLRILIPVLNSDSYLLSESTIYNSYIFYHFYSGNIISAISVIG